jgi:glycine dehydrogenase
VIDANGRCISLDETTTRADLERCGACSATDDAALPSIDALDAVAPTLIPAALRAHQRSS